MKKVLFILMFLLPGCVSHSQKVATAKNRGNRLYIGISNPLTVLADSNRCKNITLTIPGATINKGSTPCEYLARVSKPGIVTAYVKEKSSGKILDTTVFEVKTIPNPTATVARKTGGEISKKVLLLQAGIIAVSGEFGFDFDHRFVVTSFTATVKRNDKVVFTKSGYGPRFTPEFTNVWENLQVGDKVLFHEIRAVGPDKETRQVASLEFRVI